MRDLLYTPKIPIFSWMKQRYLQYTLRERTRNSESRISRDSILLFFLSEYVDVWILASWEWPVDPTDVTSFDADCNLITDTCFFELVANPPTASRLKRAVSTVNGQHAIVALVTRPTLFKVNLRIREETC
jgi:hypothetical protein